MRGGWGEEGGGWEAEGGLKQPFGLKQQCCALSMGPALASWYSPQGGPWLPLGVAWYPMQSH